MDYILRTDLVNWYTTYLMKKPITAELVQEYIQEIWVQIAEIPQTKWDDLYDQGKAAITAFVSALIHNNCISVNSKAFRHIRKPTLNEVRFTDVEWEALDEDGTIPPFINNLQNIIQE